MQLRTDEKSLEIVYKTIYSHYKDSGGRFVEIFSSYHSKNDLGLYVEFIFDRKHVARYSIGEDRGLYSSSIELAIGPRFFGPSVFWDYPNSTRFYSDGTTEAIVMNLKLLDEFLHQNK
jgi:hypothetical protein